MEVMCISSVSPITPEPVESRKLYADALGLPLHEASPGDEYHFTDQVDGCKHFGVWPLTQAAQACFGTPTWPADRPVPQVSIEFDVADEAGVAQAAQELEGRGYTLLHGARTEPWGQVVARLQTLEGAIVGVGYSPWLHAVTPGAPAGQSAGTGAST
jgi:catechol 2,3-dioxygenase-like lactoylglutathione lyase family enzyme